MTTRRRLDLIARSYPRLFPRAELMRLLRAQLGHVDALDGWIERDGVRSRARAPKLIYHICAGNLAVSAWTSLAHGLLLGARNVVKLPGDREGDSLARREILDFIHGLPAPLRKLVETHRALEAALLRRADAVVAFGSDAAMENLRAQTSQKFIAHGHALSLLWLADPNRLTTKQARACAVDVLTYDQLGCLSPQAIYVPPGTDFDLLGPKLALALEAYWQKLEKKPGRPLAVAARIAEARDMAHALGHRVWLPPKRHLGWTLIHDPDPTFQPSPLHGVIYVRQAGESTLAKALASVAGRISTVGVAGAPSEGKISAGQLSAGVSSSRLEKVFLSLGASRFCAAGRMQFPPLTWHHDGRAALADLVTWVDFENRG
jgi:Acyl-CoA reductase (LuxC)